MAPAMEMNQIPPAGQTSTSLNKVEKSKEDKENKEKFAKLLKKKLDDEEERREDGPQDRLDLSDTQDDPGSEDPNGEQEAAVDVREEDPEATDDPDEGEAPPRIDVTA